MEYERLRRLVTENNGDRSLLELSNEEIAGALELIKPFEGTPTPTLAGLLLVGKETALRDHVPAHEVSFQVLEGTDVTVNEFRCWPLLRIHEWVMQAIDVRNEEQELMMGSFRIGVPRYDRSGLREAFINALIHRDYRRLGAVHVQLHGDFVAVANPGGFVQNVQADNLLVVQPTPRNPVLANAFKRVGLVERTGRGVNIIYAGQLRNGRRPPIYNSGEGQVSVRLDSGPADLTFVENSVLAHRHLERALQVEELLVLWNIWSDEPPSVRQVASDIQRSQGEAQTLLHNMKATGLIAGYVRSGQRLFRLGSVLQEKQGSPPHQQTETEALAQQILAYVHEHGRIQRGDVEGIANVSREHAYRLLQDLVERGELELAGRGRGAYYRFPVQPGQ